MSQDWDRLRELVARLRDPGTGCPWDLEQDLASLLPYTIEEVYEVVDAVERGDLPGLCDELGDLAFHILFYARIAEEQGAFTIDEVVAEAREKLVRRHPHVFAGAVCGDAGQRARDWARIKASERARRGAFGDASETLAGLCRALPALVRADKVLQRVALTGFDWPDRGQALAKVDEEVAELHEAIDRGGDREALEAEIGDLLLAVAGLARYCEIDAETALRRAIDRFTERFTILEAHVQEAGRSIDDMTADELLVSWRRAKQAATSP